MGEYSPLLLSNKDKIKIMLYQTTILKPIWTYYGVSPDMGKNEQLKYRGIIKKFQSNVFRNIVARAPWFIGNDNMHNAISS